MRCGLCAEACHFHVATGDAEVHADPQARAVAPRLPARGRAVCAAGARARPGEEARASTNCEQWQELLYDSCTMCGRCTLVCPMGIDIAELVKEARHGMFKAGLVPERLALMDRAARQWGSTATPGRRPARHPGRGVAAARRGDPLRPAERADILVTAAPAELGEHTKALADAAKILNRIGVTLDDAPAPASTPRTSASTTATWSCRSGSRARSIDTAVKIGAKTVLLPECGHAYGAARWEAAKWYGRRAAGAHHPHDRVPRRDARGGPHPRETHRRDARPSTTPARSCAAADWRRRRVACWQRSASS